MKTYKHVFPITAPIASVWQALTDVRDIQEWGAGPAVMDDQVGTKFKLWDGDIHGTNLAVEPGRVLTQEWYGGEWPHPSRVTFTLSSQSGKTRLELVHEQIPDEAYNDIVNGWDQYYIGPLTEFVEEK